MRKLLFWLLTILALHGLILGDAVPMILRFRNHIDFTMSKTVRLYVKYTRHIKAIYMESVQN